MKVSVLLVVLLLVAAWPAFADHMTAERGDAAMASAEPASPGEDADGPAWGGHASVDARRLARTVHPQQLLAKRAGTSIVFPFFSGGNPNMGFGASCSRPWNAEEAAGGRRLGQRWPG